MLTELLHAHLLRLAVWSVLSLAIGIAVVRRNRSFGLMLAAWSLINLLICTFSWNSAPGSVSSLREFLMLNAGLDAGYIGVGLALALPKSASDALKGCGWAVAIQGLVLLILDVILLAQIRPV